VDEGPPVQMQLLGSTSTLTVGAVSFESESVTTNVPIWVGLNEKLAPLPVKVSFADCAVHENGAPQDSALTGRGNASAAARTMAEPSFFARLRRTSSPTSASNAVNRTQIGLGRAGVAAQH